MNVDTFSCNLNFYKLCELFHSLHKINSHLMYMLRSIPIVQDFTFNSIGSRIYF